MDLKLNGGVCVFISGLKASGKTHLMRYLLSSEKQKDTMTVDTTKHEFDKFNRYLPTNTQYSPEAITEINLFINKHVLPGGYKIFAIDEINNWCPNKKTMPTSIQKINEEIRHIRPPLQAFIFSARRPTSINTDLLEIADYLIFFRLVGKNDIQRLNDIRDGLGEVVFNLKDYHFVVLNQRRDMKVFSPVPG
tara:strand:- start:1174 stop:1749 length:576 start_codon:yes stop_codon:yes gene_type:complete